MVIHIKNTIYVTLYLIKCTNVHINTLFIVLNFIAKVQYRPCNWVAMSPDSSLYIKYTVRNICKTLIKVQYRDFFLKFYSSNYSLLSMWDMSTRHTCVLVQTIARHTCVLVQTIARHTCVPMQTIAHHTCVLVQTIARRTFVLVQTIARHTCVPVQTIARHTCVPVQPIARHTCGPVQTQLYV